MSGALEKHEYLDILDFPVYYLSTSIRCDWFPCQAKWELYQMGTLPYKINGKEYYGLHLLTQPVVMFKDYYEEARFILY